MHHLENETDMKLSNKFLRPKLNTYLEIKEE